MRNPMNIWTYRQLGKIIKNQNSDIIYMNDSIYSPWELPMFYSLPKNIYSDSTSWRGAYRNEA